MTKRKSHRPTRPPAQSQNGLDDLKAVHIVTYEITSEPIQDRRYKRLPRNVKDAIERLHNESQRQPHKAIPELLALIEKYPDVPVFYNYLSVAYSYIGAQKKVEEVVEENYRRNPNYLFARLNYAELCLDRGDYGEIAEIFEHKFDLKLLYPERNRFHITEVVSFMSVMGLYFYGIGEREPAEKYYEILQQIGPEHPATKRLHNTLHPTPLTRLVGRVAANSKTRQ